MVDNDLLLKFCNNLLTSGSQILGTVISNRYLKITPEIQISKRKRSKTSS